jgi:tRNA/tmRNA/rRNA uracil-C5-methylase (TrmA/RlmC/RlmD family)
LEALAVEGLERSLAEHPELKVKIRRQDVYLKAKILPPLKERGLLVDPPRAGLRQVLDWLEAGDSRPKALIYVSCFVEAFRADAKRLADLGYSLASLVGVDQFVHSPHAEWVARFRFDHGV